MHLAKKDAHLLNLKKFFASNSKLATNLKVFLEVLICILLALFTIIRIQQPRRIFSYANRSFILLFRVAENSNFQKQTYFFFVKDDYVIILKYSVLVFGTLKKD
jgi:hypothetical protein